MAIFLFVLSAIILFGVEAVLIYSIVRFRKGRPDSQVQQTRGNNTIEALWTLIPAILIIIIFTMTARTIDSLNLPGGDVELQVVGHQWWWEVGYAAEGFSTANEIHVPQGRQVGIEFTSADVIHSFWVPQIGGKTDLVPGHTNHAGFLAATPGVYLGECAEFCGLQHAHMRFYLVIESAAEFSAWIRRQRNRRKNRRPRRRSGEGTCTCPRPAWAATPSGARPQPGSSVRTSPTSPAECGWAQVLSRTHRRTFAAGSRIPKP